MPVKAVPRTVKFAWKLPVLLMGIGILTFGGLFWLLVNVWKHGPSPSAPGWQGVGNALVDGAIGTVILPLFIVPIIIFVVGLLIGIVRVIIYVGKKTK